MVKVADGGGVPEVKKVGRKNLAAIYLQGKDGKPGEVVRLTDQERVVLSTFLKTYSFEETAKQAEITKESVKRMLRRPQLKAYLEHVISKAAKRELVDEDWGIAELVDVWEGRKEPKPVQMEAMKLITKLLRPAGSGINVNVQQNSFYSGLGKEATDAEWADARATAAG